MEIHTLTGRDRKVEEIYKEIDEVLRGVKRMKNLIIMGNGNARVGRERKESVENTSRE